MTFPIGKDLHLWLGRLHLPSCNRSSLALLCSMKMILWCPAVCWISGSVGEMTQITNQDALFHEHIDTNAVHFKCLKTLETYWLSISFLLRSVGSYSKALLSILFCFFYILEDICIFFFCLCSSHWFEFGESVRFQWTNQDPAMYPVGLLHSYWLNLNKSHSPDEVVSMY